MHLGLPQWATHWVRLCCGPSPRTGTFVMIIMWRLLSKHEREMAALGVKDADSKKKKKKAAETGVWGGMYSRLPEASVKSLCPCSCRACAEGASDDVATKKDD